MGYVERVMGDNERAVYRTHPHGIVLLQRAIGAFFAFVVFLGLGLTVLLAPEDQSGDKVRLIIGVIALGSLILPLYQIAAPWVRGRRGRDFLKQIWQEALIGLCILILALIIMFEPGWEQLGWIAVVISVIPLAETIRHFLDWYNERYIITNRRVMEVRGIINKHVRDSALEKVNDVDLKQSIVGRFLRYGTVQIITGSDIGVNEFRRISNPVRFKRAMLNAKEQLHTTTPMVEGAAATPAAPSIPQPGPAEEKSSPSIPELIAELDKLREKGILSEEEFQAKKKELLGRL